MDGRKEKIKIQELVTRLQRHKGDIMRQQGRAKRDMNIFFKELRDSIQSYEVQIIKKFDQEILNFHEGVAKTINALSKTKGNASDDSIGNAEQVLNCQVIDGAKIDKEKLKQLLREVYYLKIGAFHEDSKMELPDMIESRLSSEEKMFSESAVEKLQNQRDYYQRREEELQQKIRQFEFNRKGSNIRQLSKSALEEKCSRWAIERLKEEKRVLIQKIGEASQQIIKQDGLLSEQQEEIRKLTLMINQVSGRSIVGNSSIKGSVVLQSEINHDRELELEAKNTQLTLELTNYVHRLEEVYQANKQFEKELQQKIKENYHLQQQNSDLKKECLMMKNDFEAISRKKTVIEQQLNELKNNYEDLKTKLDQQRQTYKCIVEGFEVGEKEIKQRLKLMEAEKRTQILSIQQKLINSQLEREKLLKKLEEASTKNGDESNYKQLLNDQITRLLKQNANMQKQLQAKEEQMFQAKAECQKLELDVKDHAKRLEASKKQYANMKKVNKQLEKQVAELRNRISANDNLQLKILQLDQNITTLHAQFNKYKETSERKSNQHEKIIAIIKERFALQLSQLLSQENKKIKKEKQTKSEIVEKYIEEMVVFSSKTAQIKQLKEEIRDLKDKQGKQTKQIKKRQKSTLQQSVSALQWGIMATSSKIFEERLKNEKELFEKKINQVIQLHKKEEVAKNAVIEELQRQKVAVAELKNKQKQEKIVDQNSKGAKQLEEKVQKLEQEMKRLRAKNKKLQMDLSDAQSQLKTKKQLNVGLKNQSKLKQDVIVQLNKQIDDLKQEIAKQQRNTRQMSNKEQLLKQSRQSLRKMEEQYRELLQSLEDITEKNKQLNRQLSKKDEVIKELSFIQEKQVKKKEDLLIKSLNTEITQQKETIRKLKMENERKDDIIKNNKNKLENKNKENQELLSKTQKEYDKILKQKDNLQKKVDSITSNLKREQMKANNLSWAIKKVFEMCCKIQVQCQKQESKAKPLTTQYYTNSSVSPHTLKLGTPASNFKSFISCEGLDILNLRPEDIEECLGMQTTTLNKTEIRNESWSLASPIINKRKEQDKKQALMEGLQQLEKLLTAKEMNSAQLIDHFKKVLER